MPNAICPVKTNMTEKISVVQAQGTAEIRRRPVTQVTDEYTTKTELRLDVCDADSVPSNKSIASKIFPYRWDAESYVRINRFEDRLVINYQSSSSENPTEAEAQASSKLAELLKFWNSSFSGGSYNVDVTLNRTTTVEDVFEEVVPKPAA